ncbi:transcriptional repressor [Nocardioides marinquilinus]|uniref:Transcriptional repressor n=1 Tax=Nocardioides marinquilinus TaxID=1210400 RepID=A0ABP9PJ75_9ACTN
MNGTTDPEPVEGKDGTTDPEPVEGQDATTDDWRAELRRRGYRLTPQRELILAAVDELGHATPDEVLAHVQQRASSVNASTVYRTLEVLEELGMVRHLHLGDRAPTYHSVAGEQHFHLKCRVCERVVSVDVAAVAPFADRLRAEHGFVADVGHLTVFGHCVECATARPDGTASARL